MIHPDGMLGAQDPRSLEAGLGLQDAEGWIPCPKQWRPGPGPVPKASVSH